MNLQQLLKASEKHPRLVALIPLDDNVDTAITVRANRAGTSFMVVDHDSGAHDPVFVHTMNVALHVAKAWAGWTS